MTTASFFAQKYTTSTPSSPTRGKSNSTKKWAEYACDIVVMQEMLMKTKDLKQKHQLMTALDVAERKKNYHYRQENFNLHIATTILQAFKNAVR